MVSMSWRTDSKASRLMACLVRISNQVNASGVVVIVTTVSRALTANSSITHVAA